MSVHASLAFRLHTERHWRALRGVPASVIERICRDIDAGATVDARLLLADQVRAAAEHLRHLGAENEADSFRRLAALIPVTEDPTDA